MTRVLTINLDNHSFAWARREDLKYLLGGVGVATELLNQHFAEQPIILAIGPFAGLYPAATKAVAMFISPLTKELGESYAGLGLAMAMRLADVEAVVLRGQAQQPLWLSINSQSVDFLGASEMWGMTCQETGRQLDLLQEGLTPMGGVGYSRLCIGPAGEKGVAFAAVTVDGYRHFGRLGLGAVLGKKQVKAVVIQEADTSQGSSPVRLNRYMAQPAYKKVYGQIFAQIVQSGAMEKYHDLGTAANILPLNQLGALPTRNLQQNCFEQVENISGEAFAQHTLVRKLACRGCPVGCIHLGLYRQAYNQRHDYQTVLLSYDYELIYALGTLLGLGNQQEIYWLISIVEELGLDAISTGVALAWTTEAVEQRLISTEHTLTRVEFGQVEGYSQLIMNLVQQPNDFFQTLAQGTWAAAEKYGGEGYALVLGKLEVAGYHTGYGSLFGQLIGARHSHLDNAGYSFDQEGQVKEPQQLVEAMIEEERLRCVLNSLSICLFARKIYTLPLLVEALDALGYQVTEEGLGKLGEHILTAKWELKHKLGYPQKELSIPRRFLETPSFRGKLEEEKLVNMLKHFTQQVSVPIEIPTLPCYHNTKP
ncbi:MAG: aldehyde ferredoxin oxidoreductase C-terminal domain-containing protein [Carboxydocellales bacterium]